MICLPGENALAYLVLVLTAEKKVYSIYLGMLTEGFHVVCASPVVFLCFVCLKYYHTVKDAAEIS